MANKPLALLLAATYVLLALVILNARVYTTYADSRLTLLVSQSILQDHTIKLNKYRDVSDHFAMVKFKGNYYDYFPLGTSVIALPVVHIANKAGLDMVMEEDQQRVQRYAATIINPVIFLLLFYIGRVYLPDRAAYAASFVTFLGTSLMSTLSAALASHNMAIVLASAVLLWLCKYEQDGGKAPNPYMTGGALFLAYFTRPTFSVFIVLVLSYLFIRDRRLFLRTAITSFVMLIGFMLFSYGEYGQPLPPYYIGRLGSDRFFTALYALLLSPSRGLFIYSPFLLPVVAGCLYYLKPLRSNAIFVLSLAWAAATLIVASSFSSWSGAGHSFGPRLLVDSMPAYAFMTFVLWAHISAGITRQHLKRAAMTAYILLGLAGVWINTWQGAYNPWTDLWGKYPELGQDHDRFIFDWRHPQWLATPESITAKINEYYGKGARKVIIDSDNFNIVSIPLLNPESYLDYMARAKHYRQEGHNDKAINDYTRAIELGPDKTGAYLGRASIYMDTGRYAEAAEDVTRVISLRPSWGEAYIMRGTAYDRAEKYDPAIGDFSTFISMSPEDGRGYLNRGITSLRAGDDPKQTAQDLQKAVAILPDNPMAHFYLGLLSYTGGSYQEAAMRFLESLGLNPADGYTWLFALNSIRRAGDDKAARALEQRLNTYLGSGDSSGRVGTLCKFSLGLNGYDEERVLREAEQEGSMCEAYYYIGEKRLLDGNRSGAREMFKKALETCPPRLPEYHAAKAWTRD